MVSDGKKYTNEVCAVAWSWRDVRDTAGQERAARRCKSSIQAVIAAIVGGIFIYVGWIHAGSVALVISALNAIGGWLVPSLFRAMERAVGWLARVIGTCMTWLLLVPVYFLCFTPARILMAIAGKDPLGRKFPAPDEKSFWVPYKPRPASHTEAQY